MKTFTKIATPFPPRFATIVAAKKAMAGDFSDQIVPFVKPGKVNEKWKEARYEIAALKENQTP